MTKQQIVAEFNRLSSKTKISVLRDLLDNEISDEMREDISNYLSAMRAKQEGGLTPFREYHKKKMAKKRDAGITKCDAHRGAN